MEFNLNIKNAILAKKLVKQNINKETLINELNKLAKNSRSGQIKTYKLKNNELICLGVYDFEYDIWY